MFSTMQKCAIRHAVRTYTGKVIDIKISDATCKKYLKQLNITIEYALQLMAYDTAIHMNRQEIIHEQWRLRSANPVHPVAKIVSDFKNSLVSRYDPDDFNIDTVRGMSMTSIMCDHNMWKHHIAHHKNTITVVF